MFRGSGTLFSTGDKNYIKLIDKNEFNIIHGEENDFLIVEHNLNKYPAVTLFDEEGYEIRICIRHINKKLLILSWVSSFENVTVTCN